MAGEILITIIIMDMVVIMGDITTMEDMQTHVITITDKEGHLEQMLTETTEVQSQMLDKLQRAGIKVQLLEQTTDPTAIR